MNIDVFENKYTEWKNANRQTIQNVMIDIMNYERGVDTTTIYNDLEYLLRKAFLSGICRGEEFKNKTNV